MGESLMERRRVNEDALRSVKFFSRGTILACQNERTLGIRGG